MKILIAGGSGEVGKDLTSFLSRDFEIFSSFRNKKNKSKEAKFIKINFEKKISVKIKPNIIINCMAAHSYSKKNSFNNYIGSNISAILNLIQFAREKKVKKIINVSTVSVYENTKKEIIEKTNFNSDVNNLLAVTKSIGEIILRNSDINFVNLRLPGVICSKSKTTSRPWIKNISYKLRNNKKITIYNHNKFFNSLIDTKELAKLIKLICFKNVKGTFNLSASKPIKIKDIIFFLKNFFKSRSKIKIIKDNIEYSSVISTKELNQKLKFYPATVMKILKDNLKNL